MLSNTEYIQFMKNYLIPNSDIQSQTLLFKYEYQYQYSVLTIQKI